MEQIENIWPQSLSQKQRVKDEGAHGQMKSFCILQEAVLILRIIFDDPKPSEQANAVYESWATISKHPNFFEWII